jgi:GNAT superfamily N-acetyltransferase
MVAVQRVQTPQQWKEFQAVPWRVYRDDPNWVPAPGLAERRLLDPRHNPFFEHADMACWTARRGRETCGRIAAIIDRNYNQFQQEQVGFFGFFEFPDDLEVAGGLFQTAQEWLGKQGMKCVRGPVSPSTNYECGLLVQGFETAPVILMAYNRPYYPAIYERLGLARARDLLAYWFDLTAELPAKAHKAAERARRWPGLRVRGLDPRRLNEEIARAQVVYNRAWEPNWGFVPMTDAEWQFLAREFRPLLQPELALFAEVDGDPIGFLLALPDVNPVLQGLRRWWWPWTYLRLGLGSWKVPAARLILMGMVPDFQNLGVAAILYEELYQRSMKRGYRGVEFSWVLEDNTLANRSAVAMGARLYKTYRLYEKAVPATESVA